MKCIITTTLLLCNYLLAAQQNFTGTLYETQSRTHKYYIHLQQDVAYVYRMGSYIDKAGFGSAITNTDTLTRQTTGNYTGKTSSIISDNNKLHLVIGFTKPKKFVVAAVKETAKIHSNLNNGYYLTNYIKMTEEINKVYPYYHLSFRGCFSSWKTLPNKELDYIQFRKFADEQLHNIKDSISRQHTNYTALKDHIIKNLGSFDYSTLKDSLSKLPDVEYINLTGYYAVTINEIAKQRPEYFLRLAEELPQIRGAIFWALNREKTIMEGIKAVEGYDVIKKELFKSKKG